jgi:hypothetical protein
MKMYPLHLIFGAVIWYVAFIFFTVIFYPPNGGSWEETFKALGVTISVATGLFAPISAIVMARYQGQVTADLEKLKVSYAREVEVLKSSLSSGLEVKKALIAGRIRAFDSMLTAAHFFYYVIRQQAYEGNPNNEQVLQEADKRAAEASSVVWHLSDEDRQKWFTVYQLSIHLMGLLKETPQEERVTVFNENAQDLGSSIKELEIAGLAAFSEADKYQLKLSEDEFRISRQPLLK